MGAYKAANADYEVNSLGVGQAASGVSGECKLGVGANYLQVEADGTLEFNGTATPWDDAQVVLGTAKFAGASDPTWTAYKGGLVLAFNKAQDNIMYFNVQLSHAYKVSSNIEFHIHTAHADAGAGNSIWHMTHSIAPIDSDFPAQSTEDQTIASPTDADKHQVHSFSANIGSATGISAVILCSLQREGSDPGDTYDDTVYVVAMDFHIEQDTVGSRLITTK